MTPTDKELLESSLETLAEAKHDIQAIVRTYDLPEKYDALLALMDRQKTAIENLLAGRDAGFDIESLALDREAMLNTQHIKNLAHIAGQAKAMQDPTESQTHVTSARVALHKLKGPDASAATFAHYKIAKAMGITPPKSSGFAENIR